MTATQLQFSTAMTTAEPSSTTMTMMEPLALAVTQSSAAMTTAEPMSSTSLTTMEPPALAVTQLQSSTIVTTAEPTSSTVNQKHSVSFRDVQTIPCRSRPLNKRSRPKPPSFLLTSDEHLSFLESKTKSVSKSKKGAASKISVDKNQSGKCTEDEQCKKRKAADQKGKKMKKKLSHLPFPAVSEKASTVTDATDDTPCSYCEIPYSQSNVMWHKCHVCEKWACGNCAHVSRKSEKVFICDNCK